MAPKDEVLKHLDDLIAMGQELASSYQMDSGAYVSEIPEERFRMFATIAMAAIRRVAGKDSEYYTAILQDKLRGRIADAGFENTVIPSILGALQSLRYAVDNGYLTSLESRLRANVHDDFLTQTNELIDAGSHVAAMVLAGGVLENHLLKLVIARSLTWPGSGSLAKYNDKRSCPFSP